MDFKSIYRRFNDSILTGFTEIGIKDVLIEKGLNVISVTKKAETFTNNVQNLIYEIVIDINNRKNTYSLNLFYLPQSKSDIKVSFGPKGKRSRLMGYATNVDEVADLIKDYRRFNESISLEKDPLHKLYNALNEAINTIASIPRIECDEDKNAVYITYSTEERDYTETIAQVYLDNNDNFKVDYTFVPSPKIFEIDFSDHNVYKTIEYIAKKIIQDVERLLKNGPEEF